MLENLVTDKKSIENISYIDSIENESQKIDLEISYQTNTRNKIIKLISSINTEIKEKQTDFTSSELYKFSKEVKSIYDSLNKSINLLTMLKNKIGFLQNYKEHQNKNIYDKRAKEYSNFLTNNYKILLNTCNKLQNFITNENNKKFFETFQINFNNDISTTTDENVLNDNNTLIISEKDNKVFLPYKLDEVNYYLDNYPDQFNSIENVVAKLFILPLQYYIIHPSIARFRETYSLCRNKEKCNVFDSLSYGFELMLYNKLNPAIIAACKNKEQLSHYIECLNENCLNEFTDFEIKFEVNPI